MIYTVSVIFSLSLFLPSIPSASLPELKGGEKNSENPFVIETKGGWHRVEDGEIKEGKREGGVMGRHAGRLRSILKQSRSNLDIYFRASRGSHWALLSALSETNLKPPGLSNGGTESG